VTALSAHAPRVLQVRPDRKNAGTQRPCGTRACPQRVRRICAFYSYSELIVACCPAKPCAHITAALPRPCRCRRSARRAAAPVIAQRARATPAAPCAAAAAGAVPVAELQSKFGIPGSVEFVEGRGGLPVVSLKHACGASAEVYLFGGAVCSWKQASGDEVLYVRPDAVFDKSKPISGGVPHCFPQFGPGEMQQHGFARNLDWAVASTSADLQPDERDPEVELVLTENDYTLKMWPHKFKAVYTITLHGEQLRTDLRVLNTGDKPFTFTAALHSYFEVLHVSKAKVGERTCLPDQHASMLSAALCSVLPSSQ
jgi:Aldose 1-epimerase